MAMGFGADWEGLDSVTDSDLSDHDQLIDSALREAQRLCRGHLVAIKKRLWADRDAALAGKVA